MNNRSILLFSLAACAGLFSGILVVHASDHPSTDIEMEVLIQEATASHQMQMQMTLVKEAVTPYRAEFALYNGSGDIVTVPALALDADPAPAMIQRRPSVIIPIRQLNVNWIHTYSRSRLGGHEITATNHCPAHSRLPAGGYA
jgi:hypothetical protein